MGTRTPKWWEKTVEYAYVKQYLGEYEFISPFDGEHETLSDCAIANGLQWSIIEFKATERWESAEKIKFNKHGSSNYAQAKLALVKGYGDSDKGIDHHFIVYGQLDLHRTLTLKSERYFSTENEYVFEPNNLINKGIELSSFAKYVHEFNQWKNGGNGGGFGGGSNTYPPQNPNGGLSLSNYGVVVGVCLKDNVAVVMSIEDFVKETTPANSSNRTEILVAPKPLTFRHKAPPEEDESFA